MSIFSRFLLLWGAVWLCLPFHGSAAPLNERLQLQVGTAEPNYFAGSALEVGLLADRDAWVYVFLTEADGVVRQILPNRMDKDNRLPAGVVRQIPGRTYRLLVESPAGQSGIQAFAVSRPLPVLQNEYGPGQIFREPFPRVYTSPAEIRERMTREALAASADEPLLTGTASCVFTVQPLPAGFSQPYYDPAQRPLTKPKPPSPPVDDTSWREQYRRESRSKLSIETGPAGAEILIDGVPMGESPQVLTLSAGSRRLQVEKRGYVVIEREVELEGGTRRNFSFTLKRERRAPPSRQPISSH